MIQNNPKKFFATDERYSRRDEAKIPIFLGGRVSRIPLPPQRNAAAECGARMAAGGNHINDTNRNVDS